MKKTYKYEISGCFPVLLYLVFVGLMLTGYILNIVHLFGCDFEAPYKAEILYGLGTVSGLGIIFGWFNFGK